MSNLFCPHVFFRPPTGTREPFVGEEPARLVGGKGRGSRSAGRARMPRRRKGAGAVRRGRARASFSARRHGRGSRSAEEEPARLVGGKGAGAVRREEPASLVRGRDAGAVRRGRTCVPCRGKQRGARTQIGTERAEKGGTRQCGKGSPYIHYIYCVEGQIGYHICGTGKKTAKSVKKITNFREKVRSNI